MGKKTTKKRKPPVTTTRRKTVLRLRYAHTCAATWTDHIPTGRRLAGALRCAGATAQTHEAALQAAPAAEGARERPPHRPIPHTPRASRASRGLPAARAAQAPPAPTAPTRHAFSPPSRSLVPSSSALQFDMALRAFASRAAAGYGLRASIRSSVAPAASALAREFSTGARARSSRFAPGRPRLDPRRVCARRSPDPAHRPARREPS